MTNSPTVAGWSGTKSGLIDLDSLFPETLQFVDQSPAANAESFRRFGAIVGMLAQGLENGLALDFAQTFGIDVDSSKAWPR